MLQSGNEALWALKNYVVDHQQVVLVNLLWLIYSFWWNLNILPFEDDSGTFLKQILRFSVHWWTSFYQKQNEKWQIWGDCIEINLWRSYLDGLCGFKTRRLVYWW